MWRFQMQLILSSIYCIQTLNTIRPDDTIILHPQIPFDLFDKPASGLEKPGSMQTVLFAVVWEALKRTLTFLY